MRMVRRRARGASVLLRRTLRSRPRADGQQNDSVRRDPDRQCLGQCAELLVVPDIVPMNASLESQLAEWNFRFRISRPVRAVEEADGFRATGERLHPHFQRTLDPYTLALDAARVLIDGDDRRLR